jgi:Matrixin
MRARRPALLALVLLSALVGLALLSSPAQANHANCGNARTGKSTWFISGGVPSGWTDALIDSALVWDHIQGDSHNFYRVGGPPADFNVFRGAIDGKFGIQALTPADHGVVKFDSDETWHLNVNVTPGASSLDLWSVGAHEFGHILSLAHSDCFGVGNGTSSDPTMYCCYAYGASYRRSLEAYDVNHELALYP